MPAVIAAPVAAQAGEPLPLHYSAVSAGEAHTCAVRANGTVWCWGFNGHGQLGNGTTESASIPVQVSGLSNVVSVSAGSQHTCALRSDGTVWCWGYNVAGELGDGSVLIKRAPVQVVGLASAVEIAAGTAFSCAVTAGGTLKCWGGDLKNGGTNLSPTTVDLGGPVSHVDARGSDVCAATQAGLVYCWGQTSGPPLTGSNASPYSAATSPRLVEGLPAVKDVQVGSNMRCAIDLQSRAWCWGWNMDAILLFPVPNITAQTPMLMTGFGTVRSIDTTTHHVCAITTDASVKCMGRNGYGEVGNNSNAPVLSPVSIDVGGDAVEVTRGGFRTCATLTSGRLKCWGSAKTGDGTNQDRWVPTEVVGISDLLALPLSNYYVTSAELRGKAASTSCAADPVNTATGSFFDSWVDLPSVGGVFGLGVSRAYNSDDASTSVLGRGWRSAFSQAIASEPDGGVGVTLEDGRLVRFPVLAGGGWGAPREFDGRVFADPDGSLRVDFPDGVSWGFDAAGRIEVLTRWDGQTVTVTRGGDGRVLTAVSSLGPSVSFAYEPSGAQRLVSVSSSDGRTVGYGYDPVSGFMSSVTDPSGRVTSFETDSVGRVTKVIDGSGVVEVDNTYDSAGRVASQVTPTGIVSFTYLADRTTEVSVALPGGGSETITYVHDELGRLVGQEDQFGHSTVRSYDSNGWIAADASRSGVTEESERNEFGQPGSVTVPGEGTTTIEYSGGRVAAVDSPVSGVTMLTYGSAGDPNRVPRTVTDDAGKVTTNHVVNGLIEWSEDPDGVRTTFTYDLLRRVKTSTDELSRVTTLDYDSAGRLSRVETPEGRVTTREYDPAGRLRFERVGVQDPAAVAVTEYRYDAAGRLELVVDPSGAVTRRSYYPAGGANAGKLWKIESPGDVAGSFQAPTVFEYSSLGELVKVTDPTGVVSSESTPGVLRRTESSQDSAGRSTSYTYDSEGRVKTSIAAGWAETEVVRDPDTDQVTAVEASDDAAGLSATTDYDYWPNGLVKTVTRAKGTPGESAESYTYDALGRPKTVTDPEGRTREVFYTDAGRVDHVVDAAGHPSGYGYNAAGELASVTDADSNVSTVEYWPDGLIKAEVSPLGRRIEFTYDALGRQETVTDAGGVVTTVGWSRRSEKVSETVSGRGTVEWRYRPDQTMEWSQDALAASEGTAGHRTTYDFDAAGRLLSRTTPLGTETWSYDPNTGELVSHSPVPVAGAPAGTESWTYDPDSGRVATFTDGSGRVRTNTWDSLGRLDAVGFAEPGGATVAYDYGYNERGDVTSIGAPDGLWTRAVNTTGQVTGLTGPDGRHTSWSYDTAGRRDTMGLADGTVWRYGYDNLSRLTAIRAAASIADTFTQPAGWTAPDEGKWNRITQTSGGTVAVADNRLVLGVANTSGSNSAVTLNHPNTADSELRFDYQPFDTTAANQATLRVRTRTNYTTNTSYMLSLRSDTATATISKVVSGAATTLATFAIPASSGPRRVLVRTVGSQVAVKVWDPAAGGEPVAATATVTDASITTAGLTGLQAVRQSGTNQMRVDNVVYTANPDAPQPAVGVYSYNADSQLTGETLPGGATRTWAFHPDSGRLTGMTETIGSTTKTTGLGYDAAGAVNAETVTGALATSYTYDPAGQMLTRKVANTTTAYTYDRGRMSQLKVGSNPARVFSYDDRSQLVAATGATTPNVAYGYDGAGRRTSETCACGTTTYTYDPVGQLAVVADPAATQARQYRPDGLINAATFTPAGGAASTTRIDWDTAQPVAQPATFATTSGATGLVRGPTTWAGAAKGSTSTAVSTSVYGDVLASTGQQVGWTTRFDSAGVPQTAAPAKPQLGYRGELTLGSHVFLRAREYQPQTAGFLTVDPLADVPGASTAGNPYHYGYNDPVNRVDPTGMRPNGTGGGISDEAFDRGFTAGTSSWAWEIPVAGTGAATATATGVAVVEAPVALIVASVAFALIGGTALNIWIYRFLDAYCPVCSGGSTPLPSGFEVTVGGRSVPPSTLEMLGEGNARDPYGQQEMPVTPPATSRPIATSTGSGGGTPTTRPVPDGCNATEDGRGVDRGDGRDSGGRFTNGNSGVGKEAEARGLDTYEAQTGRSVVRQQVRATSPGGGQRYYDGLAEKPDGTYEGIEVKSGSAYCDARQREFDDAVNSGGPATANLNGRTIQITSVEVVRVP